MYIAARYNTEVFGYVKFLPATMVPMPAGHAQRTKLPPPPLALSLGKLGTYVWRLNIGSLLLLRHLDDIAARVGSPLLVGPSRKRFIGEVRTYCAVGALGTRVEGVSGC